MFKQKYLARSLWGIGLLLIAISILLASGCSSSTQPTSQATAEASSPHEKGGAELWAQICARCHNIRPPTEFSRAEWQVAMHHMRIRAYLTGEEQRKILEFLKSAD